MQSYTGVKIIDVLLTNKIGPILMIAFTNHALDHILCSVLDAGITKKVVRLGSRSSDERISQFSIEAMEAVAGRSRLDRAFSDNYREVKAIEQKLRDLMKECLKTSIDSEDIIGHLEHAFPIFFQDLNQPPPWIHFLYSVNGGENGYVRVSRGTKDLFASDSTLYGYWLRADDLDFLEEAHLQERDPPPQPQVDVPSAPTPEQTSSVNANPYEILRHHESKSGASSESGSVVDTSDMSESDLDFDNAEEVLPEEAWMYLTLEAEDDVNADHSQDASDQPFVSPKTPEPAVPTFAEVAAEPIVADTSSLQEGIQPSDFHDLSQFFAFCGYNNLPPMPLSDRELNTLLDHDGIWTLSREERRKLHQYWIDEIRVVSQTTQTEEFERLHRMHANAIKQYNEGKAAVCHFPSSASAPLTIPCQGRCELLRNVDIIGCTTTGMSHAVSQLIGY